MYGNEELIERLRTLSFVSEGAGGRFNLYEYAGSDPVNVIDPTGLFVNRAEVSASGMAGIGGSYSFAYIEDSENGDWGFEACVGAGVGVGGGVSARMTSSTGSLDPGVSVTGDISGSFKVIIDAGFTAGLGLGGNLNLNELFSNCEPSSAFWDAMGNAVSGTGGGGGRGVSIGLDLSVGVGATGCTQMVW